MLARPRLRGSAPRLQSASAHAEHHECTFLFQKTVHDHGITHHPSTYTSDLLTTSSLPLTVANLLRSQRTAGNHATLHFLERLGAFTRANVLQRRVTIEEFEPDPADEAKLTEIRSLVSEYNQLCTAQEARRVKGLRERFRKLQQIDRKIYEWFGSKQVPDLLAVKNARPMRGLLRSTERERARVVDGLRKQGGSIPFEGAEANKEDIEKLESLWKSLAAQGKDVRLRIRGGPEDQRKLLGRLASIMQTEHGRRFVRYLMEHAPENVSLMFSNVAPGPAEKRGAMPGAYAAELKRTGAKEHVAEPMESKLRTAEGTGHVAVDLAKTALDYMDQLLVEAAKRAPETPRTFKAGETQYCLGTAKEAVAVVSRTEVLAEEREKLSTAAGLEVLTPTFITLMHELGHALKIVSGGYLPDDNLLMAHFVNELPQLQRKWWEAVQGRPNMLEELINVLGVENPVRQESGLAPREIYQSTRDVIVVNTRDKLREVLKRDADSSRYLPDLVKAYTDLQNPNITLQRVEEIKRNLDRITPEVQKQMKANRALYLRDRLEQFIQQQKPRDQERIQRTKRYDRLYGRLSGIANNPTLDAQNAPLEELEKELENFKEDRQTLIEAGKLIKSFQKGGLRSRLAKAVHEGGDIQDYLPWRTK